MGVATVSLCMIVRDEAAFLGACLEAVGPFVDELCVVDTGSSDATIDIAKARGARVASIPWSDSFADARNASLAMAGGDWILVLDADEVLRPTSGPALRAALGEPDLAGVFVELVSHIEHGTESVHLLRLFRNDPRHRYVGVIHEQVSPSVQRTARAEGRELAFRGLVADHYGYTNSVQAARAKAERNARLLALAVEREPDNAYSWFKYADFLRGTDPSGAAAAFERALALIAALDDGERRELSFCGEAYALAALGELRAGRVERAGALLATGRDTTSSTPHFEFVSGHWALAAGRPECAEACFARCRAHHGAPQVQSAAREITGEQSALGIARARLARGQVDEALDQLARERATLGPSPALTQWHARLLGDRGRFDEALALCAEDTDPERGGAGRADEAATAALVRLAGELALEAARPAEAERWVERTRTLAAEGGVDGACLRGQWLLARGDLAGAERELTAASHDAIAAAALALVSHARGGPAPAASARLAPAALQLVARRIAALR